MKSEKLKMINGAGISGQARNDGFCYMVGWGAPSAHPIPSLKDKRHCGLDPQSLKTIRLCLIISLGIA